MNPRTIRLHLELTFPNLHKGKGVILARRYVPHEITGLRAIAGRHT